MRDIRVLVPSIGHPTRPSVVDALHDNGERKVTVIGADMDPEGLGRHVPDVFYSVPGRTDPGYLDRVLEICREAKVDVYYALGEEEAIGSSERRAEFERLDVKVMTPGSADMLRISSNKARYHQFFAERGIPHAGFRVVDRIEELEPALRAMGYPDIDVFLKPAFSKGGRGARLVTARKEQGKSFNAKAGDAPEQSLEAVLEAFDRERAKGFQQQLAMEYLPGTYYSVDVLSQDGKVLYAIPKIRVAGSASNTTVGEVDLNPDVIALAHQVCGAFGFSFLQNYEMKLDREGRPRVYDINPRGGTSLILCAAAGANILYYAVKLALGEEVPQRPVRNRVRMLRYYKEYFRYAD